MNSSLETFENENRSPYYKLNFLQLSLVFLLFFIGMALGGFLTILTQENIGYNFTMNYIQPLVFILPFIFAIGGYYLLILKPKDQHYNFGFFFSKWYYYPVMIAMFFGLMLISELIANSIPKTGLNGILDQLWRLMEQIEQSLEKFPYSTTFMVVILAPIFEELLFRGLILKGFINNGMNPKWAIFISALIFAIIHLNPWQFVGALLLGVVLAMVYYRTQSLLNCMLLHFFNNSLATIVFFNDPNSDLNRTTISDTYLQFGFGLAAFIVFGILFLKLTKNHQWKFY